VTPSVRRRYVDWARGLAVLIMIEAHGLDSWTRMSERASRGYRNADILGGFAAPLFLWLAGVALALSASRTAERTGQRSAAVDAVCRRGLEIVILAYLFRLQAIIVSPGNPLINLFRVDILNVMGPAIAAAAIVWGASRAPARQALLFGLSATAVALGTPLIRTAHWVAAMPVAVQWYLRPAGEYTTFTLFPWAGFVFAGAAIGVLLAPARTRDDEARMHRWLGGAGLTMMIVGAWCATRPALLGPSSFWTSSASYFLVRVGGMMAVLAGLFALSAMVPTTIRWLAPLERFGRHSLFVYWIHVELVYGYATWFLHHRLPLWGTFAALALFTFAMYGAVVGADRGREMWRSRTGRRLAPAVQTTAL
jgi:uncharacterized membrane protein